MSLVDADTGEIVARRSFAENEATVERGMATFIEVGDALREIRDARQYRDDWSDFDTYLRERWGMKRAHAYRLIDSAEIVRELSPIGDTPIPQTESQARALSPLRHDPEAMAEVMDEVTTEAAESASRVTAEKIAEKVAEKKQQINDLKRELNHQADVVDELAQHLPDGFDPALNKELVRQRGELSRLCVDLVAIGDPAEFLARHAGGLLDVHYQRVADAAQWITTLHTLMEEGR